MIKSVFIWDAYQFYPALYFAGTRQSEGIHDFALTVSFNFSYGKLTETQQACTQFHGL